MSGGLGRFFVLTITLQAGLGFSALDTGLSLLPFSVGIAVAAGIAAQLTDRMGRLLPLAGALMASMGSGAMIFAGDHAGAELDAWTLAPGLVVCGLGLGLVIPSVTAVTLAGVPTANAGAASGVVNTAGQIGGAIGVAVVGVIFFGLLPEEDGRTIDPASDFAATLVSTLYAHTAIYLLSALLIVALLPKRRRTDEATVNAGYEFADEH